MIIRRLIVPLTVAVVALHAGRVAAQSAFPAPLPGQAGRGQRSGISAGARGPGSSSSQRSGISAGQRAAPAASFPVTGAAPLTGAGLAARPGPAQAGPADQCMKGFLPLREDAEKRGKLIKAASERHAPPDEACKLIGNFGQAEIKMIKYVETNAAKCGIPPQIPEQLKSGHKHTEEHAEEGLRRWRSRRSRRDRPARA